MNVIPDDDDFRSDQQKRDLLPNTERARAFSQCKQRGTIKIKSLILVIEEQPNPIVSSSISNADFERFRIRRTSFWLGWRLPSLEKRNSLGPTGIRTQIHSRRLFPFVHSAVTTTSLLSPLTNHSIDRSSSYRTHTLVSEWEQSDPDR